jgi:hypothetical protein
MFARLERRDPGLRKRIVAIERAHRTLGAAGKELLAAAERKPGRAGNESELAARIGAYVHAQREHMTIEERDLFPRARQLLDEDDLAAIDRDFRRVTDPIFEASVRDAYAAYPAVVRMLVEQPAVRQVLASRRQRLRVGGGARRTPARRAGGAARTDAQAARVGVIADALVSNAHRAWIRAARPIASCRLGRDDDLAVFRRPNGPFSRLVTPGRSADLEG